MPTWLGVRHSLRTLLCRRAADRETRDEIAYHLECAERAHVARGLTPAEAKRRATAEFGGADAWRSATADVRRGALLEGLWQDVQFTIRSFRRARVFAAAVVATLALAIGANTTIFSIVASVVLRPLAGVPNADRLFEAGESMSYPEFREVVAAAPSLSLAALSERRVALGLESTAAQAIAAVVSGNFFDVTGVRAFRGRVLSRADDTPDAPPVGVITYDYWVGTAAADSAIVGRTLRVNGAAVTIIGIAAPGFKGLHLGVVPSVWIPIHAWPALAPSSRTTNIENRNWGWLTVVGRSAPGATLERTHQMLAPAFAALDPGAPPYTLAQRSTPRPAQSAALPSRGGTRDNIVRFVVVLMGVVVLVLIAACANIAGLMLSRAAHREAEIGVRIALGAGRGRLTRQLLTETLVLSVMGGMAGLGVFLCARIALWRATLPGGMSGRSIALSLDARVLGFAALLSFLTAIAVGLSPALQASRLDAISALKGAGNRRGTMKHRLRGTLITVQVASALMLLIGTGLFARALRRAVHLDLGFDEAALLGLAVDPGLARFDAPRARAYYRSVLQRVEALPDVKGASWVASAPLTSDYDRGSASIQGYSPAPDERVMLETNVAGPHFHEVLGDRMLNGRNFDEHDDDRSVPVAIVNETLAKTYFAGRVAVGSAITIYEKSFRVVGVVRDVKYHHVNEAPRPYIYFALLQADSSAVGSPTLVVRANHPSATLHAVLDAARSADPAVPIVASGTMSDRLGSIFAPQVAGTWLLGAFALLALVVATVGIYGTVAYTVSQRTREIGIRLALGARRSDVLLAVVRSNAGFVLVGIPIGVGLSLLLARGISGFLYGVSSADAITLAAASCAVLLTASVASFVPARHAARLDPLLALRGD